MILLIGGEGSLLVKSISFEFEQNAFLYTLEENNISVKANYGFVKLWQLDITDNSKKYVT